MSPALLPRPARECGLSCVWNPHDVYRLPGRVGHVGPCLVGPVRRLACFLSVRNLDGYADDVDTRAGSGENPIAVCVLPGGCASRPRFNTSEDR